MTQLKEILMKKIIPILILLLSSISAFAEMQNPNLPDNNANLLKLFEPGVRYSERSSGPELECGAFQKYYEAKAAANRQLTFIELQYVMLQDRDAYIAQLKSNNPECIFKELPMPSNICLIKKIDPEQAGSSVGHCYTGAFAVKHNDGVVREALITKDGSSFSFLGWTFNKHNCEILIRIINEALPLCE
jgi:uncharacterized membrane protein